MRGLSYLVPLLLWIFFSTQRCGCESFRDSKSHKTKDMETALQLLKIGLLSDEEFEAKKAEILADL